MSKKKIYKGTLFIIDFLVIFLIYFLSPIIINNFQLIGMNYIYPLEALFYTVIISSVFLVAGCYNLLWMYRTNKNFYRMSFAIVLANLIIAILWTIFYFTKVNTFSFATMLLAMLLEFAYIFLSRILVTYYLTHYYKKDEKRNLESKRTLIVGGGSAGSMILNELSGKEFGYKIVGILDDSKDKIGTLINSVKVYGPICDINHIIKKLEVSEVIVAMPSAGKAKIQEICNLIDYKDVNVQIIPDKALLLQKDLNTSLRKVEISDLLGRGQIELDTSGLEKFIGGKTILVTGGGGSIGSEICRQVLNYNPKQLIIFDIYENTMYELQMELNMKYKDLGKEINYTCLVGSVRDKNRLEEVFSTYKPNIVFHAAAHKHVPLMEVSPAEAIKNNVKGTYNVASMADKYKVEKMVLISTDKAVNPTNVMGATKRFCEMVMETWNTVSKDTRYSMVRFGNVLGSHGSVIPLFQSQIEHGGPVTVTHPEINRFFMTIPEACGLVIQSGAYANGGEKFILDMGNPVKIVDLAKNMIKLSGLQLGKDINIEFTGLRPGEKLYEELLLQTANASKTQNEKIFVEYVNNALTLDELDSVIDYLVTHSHENQKILEYLKEIEERKKAN